VTKKISVIGIVGVPASYGGFETLVENLVRYHNSHHKYEEIVVYCSRNDYTDLNKSFLSAELRYIPLSANGMQSIPYDFLALFAAVLSRTDTILLLGVSGAIALPLVRLFSSAKIITNIDGIEWRRQKWRGIAKHFLRFSEMIAVRFSHVVISDNDAISRYVQMKYPACSRVIAYGGDHVLAVDASSVDEYSLPDDYMFSVCRIEPENNIEMIVHAFAEERGHNLVFVGNWNNSEYGKNIRERHRSCENIYLLDPIYDLGKLKTLRANASYYIHGHSAGGTNPSLVEAMHFGKAIFAYDCEFNRSTTENAAIYFSSGRDIVNFLDALSDEQFCSVGESMLEIARRRYTWDIVASDYFALFDQATV
jgi:glycosyltransferase involved in cell wall biosynthesis